MIAMQQPYLNTRENAGYRFLGVPTLTRATGETTNGAFGMIEHWEMPVGFASPYHTHHREDECFYVLEGPQNLDRRRGEHRSCRHRGWRNVQVKYNSACCNAPRWSGGAFIMLEANVTATPIIHTFDAQDIESVFLF